MRLADLPMRVSIAVPLRWALESIVQTAIMNARTPRMLLSLQAIDGGRLM